MPATDLASASGQEKEFGMDKHIYLSIMAALATAAAIVLFALLALPIFKPLAWALIIGIATLPHHARLARKLPGHPDRAAGLMVVAITVCFILPVAAVIGSIALNAADWYKEGERLIQALSSTGAGTLSHIPFAREILSLEDRFGIDFSGAGAKLAAGFSGYLLTMASNTAQNLGELIFTLALALFLLFFIYRDGERSISDAITRFAGNKDKIRHYYDEMCATTTAVTVGTILTCLVQGLTAGLGYYVAGVPAPILCGAMTTIAALIPVVGTAIVWVPLVALVAINGAYLKAVLLAIWCLIFVGLSDNAIRPLAIGAKSNIPVPAIVLGAVSGVMSLGILGLIVGPVVFSILMTLWRDLTSDDLKTNDPA